MTDENGQSKGFGFVDFETEEEADNAINEVNEMSLTVEQVNVDQTMSCDQRPEAGGSRGFTNIFIKNIDDRFDEVQFRELFSKYGTILRFTVKHKTVFFKYEKKLEFYLDSN